MSDLETVNRQLREENSRLVELIEGRNARLRDVFAGQALNAMLSGNKDAWAYSVQHKQELADAAFSYAGKMIKARQNER